jgi:site-specific DNA-methyltransferase (adenine-specific)
MNDSYRNLYNPDVLSTLANLSSDEVFTPPHIVNQMLDMLPQDLFKDKKTTFLDPATKSGVFLREIAKRLLVGLENEIPNLQERIDHIFQKQLFGIAITEMTSLLSRRSVYCSKYPTSKYSISLFQNSEGNIRFRKSEHNWINKKCIICGASKFDLDRSKEHENHAYEFIHNPKKEEIYSMKFDVIIGNPPYHLKDGGGTGSSAIPIYQKFIEQSLKLNPRYLSMIIPARWFSGGKGLINFRKEMIQNRSIKILHDFINSSDCFPNVNIEGGICYFLHERNYDGPVTIFTHQQNGNVDISTRFLDDKNLDIFVRDEKVLEIVKLVLSKKLKPFSSLVHPRNPFGIGNASKDLKDYVKNGYKVLGRFKGKRSFKYIEKSKIDKSIELIQLHKIFVSKADGAAGQIGNPIPARILGKPELGQPNEICTETFLTIGGFNSSTEMENAVDFMKTKFFRFLVGSRKNKNMTQNTYYFVPSLDFSIKWTDEMLYQFFNLSISQVEYVENMITKFDENQIDDSDTEEEDE